MARISGMVLACGMLVASLSCLSVLAEENARVSVTSKSYDVEFYLHFDQGIKAALFGPEPQENAPKFGQGSAFSYLATADGDLESDAWGSMSGIYVRDGNSQTSESDTSLEIFNIRFNKDSPFPASVITVAGQWTFGSSLPRELSVVGGTGAFAFARGQIVLFTAGPGTYRAKLNVVVETVSVLNKISYVQGLDTPGHA